MPTTAHLPLSVGQFASETNVWNGNTWPKADMPLRLTNVHFPRKSGHEVRQSEKTIQWTAVLRQCP
jgi:hypothetical protein